MCHPNCVWIGFEIELEELSSKAVVSKISEFICPELNGLSSPPRIELLLSSENCFASSPKSSP